MGRYINWDDVVGRYPRISDIGGANMVGSAYIDYAEMEIDGRMTQYTVPFSSNNLTVRDLCIDLTYIKAITPASDKKAKEMRDVLNARITRLNNNEERMILSDGTAQTADSSIAWSETEDYAPVFGAGDVTDFMVDSGRLYDEEQARL